MRLFLIILGFVCSFCANGQGASILVKGVVELEDNSLLEGAGIFVFSSDRTLKEKVAISDSAGRFEFDYPLSQSNDSLKILITYLFCNEFTQTLELEKSEIQLDTIRLYYDNAILETVTITSKPIPVQWKSDTLVFDPDAFNTSDGATVEDLLSILPGVEVNQTGEVFVNGKKVDKILVDGEPFFGNNGTIAMRNITKEMLELVEIMDTKTEKEAFLGQTGQTGTQTINLVLQKDKRKGSFGLVTLGGGTSNHYLSGGALSFFNGDQRLSIVGGSNNINASQFSMDPGLYNLQSILPNSTQGLGIQNQVRINFSDRLGKKINLNGNYNFSNVSDETKTLSGQDFTTPLLTYFVDNNSIRKQIQNYHSVDLDFQINISSNTQLTIRPRLTVEGMNDSTKQRQLILNENREISSDFSLNTFTDASTISLDNEIEFLHKINKKGQALTITLNNFWEVNEEVIESRSQTEQFDSSSSEVLEQGIYKSQKSRTNKLKTIYRLPLKSKTLFLLLGSDYSLQKSQIRQFAGENLESPLTIYFDETLSYNFNQENQILRPYLSLELAKNKLRATVQSAYHISNYRIIDRIKEVDNAGVQRNFSFPYFVTNGTYQLNETFQIRGNYKLQYLIPQYQQLVSLPNALNPFVIPEGNAELDPSTVHTFNIGINSYNFKKKQSYYANFDVVFNQNQIITTTAVDDNFITRVNYINSSNTYTYTTNFNFKRTFDFDSLNTIDISSSLNLTESQVEVRNNDLVYKSLNLNLSPKINLGWKRHSLFSIDLTYLINYNTIRYKTVNLPKQINLQHQINLSSKWNIFNQFSWSNELMFFAFPNTIESEWITTALYNTALTYTTKNKKNSVKFIAFDVLGKNQSIAQKVHPTFILTTERTVLERYFLLTYSRKF